MQRKITLFFFFVFLLFSQNAEAATKYKKGYIIESNGTKIEGYIKIQEGSKKFRYCTFKKEKTGIQLTYLPFELKAYYVKGELFVSKKIPTNGYSKPVFVCILTEETLGHYRHEAKEGKESYHVGKVNEEVISVLRADNFIEVLNAIDCDCDGPVEKLVTMSYKPRKITKWIEEYNTVCQKQQ